MEFPFEIARAFKLAKASSAIIVLDEEYLSKLDSAPKADPKSRHRFSEAPPLTKPQAMARDKFHMIQEILDKVGKASAIAQNLKQPVTSAVCLQGHPSYRIYVPIDGRKVIGILKVGRKKLYAHTGKGSEVKPFSPLCVLDFYIADAVQRQGYGQILFEYMLKRENVNPGKLAYDNPTTKMLRFLEKHYRLSDSVPQANSFVIYSAFFQEAAAPNRCSPEPEARDTKSTTQRREQVAKPREAPERTFQSRDPNDLPVSRLRSAQGSRPQSRATTRDDESIYQDDRSVYDDHHDAGRPVTGRTSRSDLSERSQANSVALVAAMKKGLML